MTIKIKSQQAPAPQKKYIFGARKAAASAQPAESPAPAPVPKPLPPVEQNQSPTQRGTVQQTRVLRKITRDVPPNLPFLRFEGIAGRGGMAVVWRAWHRELQRAVAVKVLDKNFAASGKDVRQFMMEVRTMTDLHHQGIVQGYGADCVDGRYYFIMDYVDGYTFGSLLNRKSRLPEIDALIICESVADAMKYAWDTFQIVHCDIKPENIMVDKDGTVKITDLGLCQSTTVFKNGSESDDVIGTPAYISPEQIYGEKLDCRADIYSLGATLYHLTTGHMLFPLPSNDDILRAHVNPDCRAPDPRTFAPQLSDGFVYLLTRMLVKDKNMRFQNWEDVFETACAVERGEAMPLLPAGIASSVCMTPPQTQS